MNNIPVVISLYVNAPVTVGTLYIGSYEVLYGYTSAVLHFMVITMKFVPKQHELSLESFFLVAKVTRCGYDIVYLLLD